jgi:hypothetical protein
VTRLASGCRRRELDAEHAAIVATALQDNPGRTLDHARAKLPGDPQALRGIPALTRGVGGAIAGTRPGLDSDRPARYIPTTGQG